ncbi:MAG: fucokinase [Eubacteriales bacterium]|nr:fucokinase [Eubacteriales bacterium]
MRLPVRVNWGGGWSDTPPYCMEHGGTVLNAAVSLGGCLPIEGTARRMERPVFALGSTDIGSYREFTDVQQLRDCQNPSDSFALHKAALLACGVVPRRGAASVQEICRALGGGLHLNTCVHGIPKGSGLGTSSILAGACVMALLRAMGREPSDDEVFRRVLCMEQLMSTGGGWQDQVGGIVPGIKMITTQPGLEQNISWARCRVPEQTLAELSERFALIYTGQRRLARNLLRDVVSRCVCNDRATLEAHYAIQRLAALMRFELEKGNVDGFARLLTEHWRESRRIDAGSTNTCIDQIFLAIDDLIDGRMICGAGGGGFLQVVLKKGVSKERLRERLNDVFQDSGVDVWACAFV